MSSEKLTKILAISGAYISSEFEISRMEEPFDLLILGDRWLAHAWTGSVCKTAAFYLEMFPQWIEHFHFKDADSKILIVPGPFDDAVIKLSERMGTNFAEAIYKATNGRVIFLTENLFTFKGITIYVIPWVLDVVGSDKWSYALPINKTAAKYQSIPEGIDIIIGNMSLTDYDHYRKDIVKDTDVGILTDIIVSKKPKLYLLQLDGNWSLDYKIPNKSIAAYRLYAATTGYHSEFRYEKYVTHIDISDNSIKVDSKEL